MSRRSDIIDAIETRLNLISIANGYNTDLTFVGKRMIHWTDLDNSSLLPAILINFGEGGQLVDGPTPWTEIGSWEETLPLILRAVVKETPATDPLTVLAMNLYQDILQALGTSFDFGISGVHNWFIPQFGSAGGWASPYEITDYRLNVIHSFRKGDNV